MPTLPMFPLGTVLLPAMPFALRVFEPRYLKMVGELLETDYPEFGIVLIERGAEVGGGEQRFGVGTVARITEIEAPEGHLVVTGHGTRRFEVTRWLDDDPFPRAEVEFLDGLDEPIGLALRLDPLEQEVRDTLALAHDYDLGEWPVDTPVADEPVSRLWQLAGIAPLSTIDQFVLLRSENTEELFTRVMEMTRETRQGLSHPEAQGQSEDQGQPEDQGTLRDDASGEGDPQSGNEQSGDEPGQSPSGDSS
ncbi:DNA-binding ATP-dependent protease La [Pontimonas salivibrio]|uniref:DNA-binding ATP-dependent protease La n=1 Tax=Pontimonas salivibrio TaxID=1159327 RepID=A0A2L2BPE3_9MICO|nr:LON peptidase substrate-binding domain-containing protein [Pontimonas salivibrio]AVG23535.1 DNA-binding ATP-dependent protease La [Pontimonas salivibrio]